MRNLHILPDKSKVPGIESFPARLAGQHDHWQVVGDIFQRLTAIPEKFIPMYLYCKYKTLNSVTLIFIPAHASISSMHLRISSHQ